MKLENISIHKFLIDNKIKTEKGKPIEFHNHFFLFDIYSDFHPWQAVLKAAQIGLSTLQIIKVLWVAKNLGVDLIYTLPTDNDTSIFVAGKVNRIIRNNPIFQDWTKDKDTIEQKNIANAMTYWRGTFTKRAAISVTSDLNVHDEVDFSDQEVIEDYESRIQHSDYRGQWFFGHPSTVGVGVTKYWDMSDQKHWFIKCPKCKREHYMKFPESICFERKIFQCKYCKAELSNVNRRQGRWVRKHKDRKYSGYWIPLLIAPWIKADYIIEKYNTKPGEFFYNRVLGLPYVGSGNKVTQDIILGNLTKAYNPLDGRIVIGCDTGKQCRYVIGNQYGLIKFGQTEDKFDKRGNIVTSKYKELYEYMERWENAIIIFDQAGDRGDAKAVREFREKYPGRVFLAFYREDRKTQELVRWNDETGSVVIDRNKTIQLTIDEFADKKIPIFGDEAEWWDYWLHWDKIYRTSEETALGTIKYTWLRSGRDDWVHATIYWRVGMSRFSNKEGQIFESEPVGAITSHEIMPDMKVIYNPRKSRKEEIAMPIKNWKIY